MQKPLGIKAYGSIPHLLSSRLGPGDHHVHKGQDRICLEKPRDDHDVIIVQEKLDGSCCAIANADGNILALTRSGYLAQTSPYEQHQLFAQWVQERQKIFLQLLHEGERVCGEWLVQAHGTRYQLRHDPFAPFDIMRGVVRVSYFELIHRLADVGMLNCMPCRLMIRRGCSVPLYEALAKLGVHGFHGAIDAAEGLIYRVERDDKVDFLAKHVREEKIPGRYLPEISGDAAVWNWRPTTA